MKRNIKKLQLQKKTITQLTGGQTRNFNGGAQAATAPPFSCRLPCGPTQTCPSVNLCPTTTMPSANCPIEP